MNKYMLNDEILAWGRSVDTMNDKQTSKVAAVYE